METTEASLGVSMNSKRLARNGLSSSGETMNPFSYWCRLLVPTWQLETWFAYLDGEVVDENQQDYPRLRRPRDCQKHVDILAEMCRDRKLRSPTPFSLVAACEEYDRLPT